MDPEPGLEENDEGTFHTLWVDGLGKAGWQKGRNVVGIHGMEDMGLQGGSLQDETDGNPQVHKLETFLVFVVFV